MKLIISGQYGQFTSSAIHINLIKISKIFPFFQSKILAFPTDNKMKKGLMLSQKNKWYP